MVTGPNSSSKKQIASLKSNPLWLFLLFLSRLAATPKIDAKNNSLRLFSGFDLRNIHRFNSFISTAGPISIGAENNILPLSSNTLICLIQKVFKFSVSKVLNGFKYCNEVKRPSSFNSIKIFINRRVVIHSFFHVWLKPDCFYSIYSLNCLNEITRTAAVIKNLMYIRLGCHKRYRAF